ncbi:MAG: phage portal protein [Clostridiaceae bacterium]|nr:phage portal protein [Clostridiaceae bacterium]
MTESELNKSIIADYNAQLPYYEVMQRYYIGDHDLLYFQLTQPKDQIAIENFVSKFIDEEVNYCLNNPISYVSKSGNTDMIKAIDTYLYHWKTNHNAIMMQNFETFGKCYNLSYIDAKGRFCERLLTPLNAIAYCDSDNVPQRFIHFYTKKYDNDRYYDIYYPDGCIEIYRNDGLIDTKTHPFKGVPVSVCEMNNVSETIFSKIRTLQDAYNRILSDQVAIIDSYKNAYLIMTGVSIDDATAEMLRSKGLLALPEKGEAKWLMKDMNATYIENMLSILRNAMFSATNHIDGNEKLQSNTSSLAIRSRLIFLEQRSKAMYDYISDAIYDRLERLFEYLKLKNIEFDVSDIKINFTPSIPVDLATTVNVISQLGDKISNETALSLLNFIESPILEMEKIKKERADLEQIDLDKINGNA